MPTLQSGSYMTLIMEFNLQRLNLFMLTFRLRFVTLLPSSTASEAACTAALDLYSHVGLAMFACVRHLSACTTISCKRGSVHDQ